MKRIDAFAISLFMIIVGGIYGGVITECIINSKHIHVGEAVWWWLMIPSCMLIAFGILVILLACVSPTKPAQVDMSKEEWHKTFN